MKKILFALLFSTAACAQSVTIPVNSLSFTVTANGTTVKFTGPTTAVTLPVTLPAATAAGQVLTSTAPGTTYTAQTPAVGGGSGLPAGLAYSASAGLTVAGGVTATGIVTGSELAVTGGTAVPTNCANSLLVLQYAAATNVLTPVCLPPITVTQASPGGPITLTP